MAESESASECGCAVCGADGRRCSGCGQAWYCGTKHQAAHWPKHKSICKPYKEITREGKGRCLIATRRVAAGELLLTESAVVVGPPTLTSANAVVCVACLTPLNSRSASCSRCGLPLCDAHCQGLASHSSECAFLSQAEAKLSVETDFHLLTPIRCLKCNSCLSGHVVPVSSLDTASDWRCDACGLFLASSDAAKMDSLLANESSRVNLGSIASMEKFLATYEQYLHPNHAFLSQLKHYLSEGYGRLPEKSVGVMTAADWLRKEQLCRHLLHVYALTGPKLEIIKGVISLELCDVLLRRLDSHNVDSKSAVRDEVEQLLSLSEAVFQHEDAAAPEGALKTKALNFRQALNRMP